MCMKTKGSSSDKLASLTMLMKTHKLTYFSNDVYEKKGSYQEWRGVLERILDSGLGGREAALVARCGHQKGVATSPDGE